jgi:hypothetical protein
MLLRDFGPCDIFFMTMCIYYFRYVIPDEHLASTILMLMHHCCWSLSQRLQIYKVMLNKKLWEEIKDVSVL